MSDNTLEFWWQVVAALQVVGSMMVVEITYPGNTAPMKTTYTISGDTLTIKDSLDKDVVYKKVK